MTGSVGTLERFELLKILGEGTYGVVNKARCKITGIDVAIKKVKYSNDNEGVPSTTLREVSILRSLNHQNIVRLFDVTVMDKEIFLVFEFLDSDLKDLLNEKKKSGGLGYMKTKNLLYQLLMAIDYCHSHRIFHRDIKPQNILVSSNFVLKLADFGLSRTFNVPVRCYTKEVITLWYRAPEIILESLFYNSSIDIWSIGCIFSEMSTGKPIFYSRSEVELLMNIFHKCGTPNESTWFGVHNFVHYNLNFPKWDPADLSDSHPDLCSIGIDLLTKMFTYDTRYRITANNALKHQFFSQINQKASCSE